MCNTYRSGFWWVDYAQGQEDDIDPMESEEALEEYIERRRRAFHKEWDEYRSKAYD